MSVAFSFHSVSLFATKCPVLPFAPNATMQLLHKRTSMPGLDCERPRFGSGSNARKTGSSLRGNPSSNSSTRYIESGIADSSRCSLRFPFSALGSVCGDPQIPFLPIPTLLTSTSALPISQLGSPHRSRYCPRDTTSPSTFWQ